LQRNLLAQVQTQSSQANSLADIQEIEAWVREELASLPVPKPALEKQLAGLLADAQKRIDAKRGTLAFWAGVQEEQYVHLAIVFTDMIGSTALNSRFGDATWDAIRSAHFRQARTFIERLHGWYIKDVGDAVVAVFKNAVDALSFAMELEKTPGHEMIRIKAAAHIGTVIIRGNDIFGNEVNLASRIQNMAREGGVWMSEGVRAEWRSRHGKSSLSFTRHPDVELKGLDEPITLWSIPSGFQLPQPVGAMTETKPPVEEKPLGFGSFGRIFGAMISRKPPPQAAPSTPPPRVAPATPPRVAAKVVLEQADALARQARADEIVRLILQNPNLQAELLQRKQMAENLQSEILAQAANFVDKASPDEIKKLAGQYPHVAALKPLEEAARKAAGPAARKGG
jgi:class 3 adenylate cyclase